jgi:hypothetical protein
MRAHAERLRQAIHFFVLDSFAHPALPKATISGQFVQILGRKGNPRGGDVLVEVRQR